METASQNSTATHHCAQEALSNLKTMVESNKAFLCFWLLLLLALSSGTHACIISLISENSCVSNGSFGDQHKYFVSDMLRISSCKLDRFVFTGVEEVGALDDCYPAVTIGCTKDSHCRKPCCNDDDTYTDWICRDLLCLCCKNFENPKSCFDSWATHVHSYALWKLLGIRRSDVFYALVRLETSIWCNQWSIEIIRHMLGHSIFLSRTITVTLEALEALLTTWARDLCVLSIEVHNEANTKAMLISNCKFNR